MSPAREENSLLPGTEQKPADVFIPCWDSGRDTAIDVGVVSPVQTQLVRKAAEEQGSAAEKRFNEKLNKYSTACENEGIKFYPVIVETFGGWHHKSEEVLNKLAHQLASKTGGSRAETTAHFYQRLGILLTRGNAALIISRTPDYVDASIDGDLDIDS